MSQVSGARGRARYSVPETIADSGCLLLCKGCQRYCAYPEEFKLKDSICDHCVRTMNKLLTEVGRWAKAGLNEKAQG